jgi:predicted anti-sigma-YlaC factor YlaD
MHARTEDLISLRDDEPVSATIAAHVAGCDSCRHELQRLRRLREQLRRLPEFEPPLVVVPSLPATQVADPERQRMRTRRWLPLTAAASAMLAVLAIAWSLTGRAPSNGVDGFVANPELETLVSRSQHLEELLGTLPPRPTIERVATSATIEELQARIQLVDSQLLAPAERRDLEQAQQLWSERVLLMNSLVGMRYAEATRVGYVPDNQSGEW